MQDGDSNELLDMLNTFLSTGTTKEEKKQRLAEEFGIPMTQKLEQEVDEMCNLSVGIERKGIEKGVLNSIKNLMESMGWTADVAMNALKISQEDQVKYSSILTK